MTEAKVRAAMDVSLGRMKVSQLDMLQFHWWDYSNPGYKDALQLLATMQQPGSEQKIVRNLALTNFVTVSRPAVAAGVPSRPAER